MVETLDTLLNRCTVRILDPVSGEQGTGFFVAQGQVLTCTHVIKAGADQHTAIRVFWRPKPAEGFLEASAQVSGWDAGADLALLRLETFWAHPCAWLGEGVTLLQNLYCFGYPTRLAPRGIPITLRMEGFTEDESPTLLTAKEGQIEPGMSGAPVLNLETGRVCGVMAWTKDESSALGGRAILTQAIWRVFPDLMRDHQRWQQEDQRWRAALAISYPQPNTTIGNRNLYDAMKPTAAAPDLQSPPAPLVLLQYYPNHWVGRERELDWLLTRLRAGMTSAITAHALRGMGGIGKTALAAVAVKRLHDEGSFTDGIAFLQCERQVNSTDLLRQVLTEFHPQRRSPEAADYNGLVHVAGSLIRAKRVLIVLDNLEPGLEDVDKVVKPLEALGATLLLTARHALPSDVVPAEATWWLDRLPPEEALDLFAQYYGRRGGAALTSVERAAAERIVQALDRHTLAIRLAGAYAAGVQRDLTRLAEELEDLQQALDLKEPSGSNDSKSVARILAKSLEALDPPTRQFFAALVNFAPKGFGRQAALALGAGLGLGNQKDALDLLVARSLVERQPVFNLPPEADYERLHLHALLRALAEREPQQAPDAGLDSLARYYVEYSSKIRGAALALDELNIIVVLEWAHKHERYELIAGLCSGMAAFWRDFGRAEASLRYLPWGLKAAEVVISERPSQEMFRWLATLKYVYGQFLRLSGKSSQVEPLLQEARTIFREIGDTRGQSAVLTGLGNNARDRGDYEKAKTYHEEGLQLVDQGQDHWRWAIHKAFLGQLAEREGDLKQAELLLHESEVQYRRLGDFWGEGLALQLLGKVDLRRCQLQQAEDRYQKLLKIHRELGARRAEGVDLNSLGEIALRRGHLEKARQLLKQSLSIRQEVRDRRGEGVDYIFLGQVYQAQEDFDQAEKWFQQGLTIFSDMKESRAQGWAYSCLGQLALQRGQLDEAADLLEKSLSIRRTVRDRPGEATDLRALGQLAQQNGQLDEAERYLQDALTLARQNEDLQEEGRVEYYRAHIAQARGESKLAEKLYRQSLSIRRQIQADQDVVTSLVDLGRMLITHHSEREGCTLLQEAAQVAQAAGLLAAQKVKELSQRLCPTQP